MPKVIQCPQCKGKLFISRNMLGKGLISDEDFAKIERLLDEKYQPIFRAA